MQLATAKRIQEKVAANEEAHTDGEQVDWLPAAGQLPPLSIPLWAFLHHFGFTVVRIIT